MRKSLIICVSGALLLAAAPAVPVNATPPAAIPVAGGIPPAQQDPRVVPVQQTEGPQVIVNANDIVIAWGEDDGHNVPYDWNAVVENPNDWAVGVKVRLDFVNEQGEVIYEDSVTGQVGPNSSIVMRQTGSMPVDALDRVVEARGEPSAWWLDDAYRIRTLAAFVDGLQRLEIFFVLEDWRGRPVTSPGIVDLYIVEKERARAEFEGGGMRRRLTTLYARRFNIHADDYARRRIGFISTDYTPPAVTLGPIHYSIFDHEPRGDEGLVRVVFRTPNGTRLVAEDRVFF